MADWDLVKIKIAEGMLWGGILGIIFGFCFGLKKQLTGPELGEHSILWGIRTFAGFGLLFGITYTIKLLYIG